MNATAAAQAVSALERAVPMLKQLGDYVGNGPIDPNRPNSLGERCDLLLDIRDLLNQIQEQD